MLHLVSGVSLGYFQTANGKVKCGMVQLIDDQAVIVSTAGVRSHLFTPHVVEFILLAF